MKEPITWDVMFQELPVRDEDQFAPYVPAAGDRPDPFTVTGRYRAWPRGLRVVSVTLGLAVLVGATMLALGPSATWWYGLVGIVATAVLAAGGAAAARIRPWAAPSVSATADGLSAIDIHGVRHVARWSDLVSLRISRADMEVEGFVHWADHVGRVTHVDLGNTIDLTELLGAVERLCPLAGVVRHPGNRAYGSEHASPRWDHRRALPETNDLDTRTW